MSFRRKQAPPPPPPAATPLPVEEDVTVRDRARAELAAAGKRRGYSSTIMSGQLGDPTPAPVKRTTLLGG